MYGIFAEMTNRDAKVKATDIPGNVWRTLTFKGESDISWLWLMCNMMLTPCRGREARRSQLSEKPASILSH